MTEQALRPSLEELTRDAGDIEKLLPELRGYVFDSPLGPMVKHPLVFQVGMFPHMANRAYEVKSVEVERLVGEGKLGDAIWHYERPWRMLMLHRWWKTGRVDRDRLRVLLPDIWRDTEQPHQFGRKPSELFRAAGPELLSDAPVPWATGDVLTVWRGGRPQGISWTLDRKRAEWFAGRFDGESVWRGTIEASKVWAYFERRNEQEVVLNPRRLKSKVAEGE